MKKININDTSAIFLASFSRSFFLCLVFIFIFCNIANADPITIDFGAEENGPFSSRLIQIIGIITILSIAPSILIMITSFTRIAVVLSFVRTALGLQQTPPNAVLISLSLFLTFFTMAPVFNNAYEDGLRPMLEREISEEYAIQGMIKPFQDFMIANTRNQDLELFIGMSKLDDNIISNKEQIPLYTIIPAFMISELKKAFEIGFLIFLPFLIIDITISAILMSMGMMMLPPVVISLPFKLIFFTLIDGWFDMRQHCQEL
ncbi:MAG: flagellar type III secretion system pore protein FliP [Proteobacteria bacterium]|nr:flagellar type III secretion system pore protein FliP [Pseudomonadota bacterium]